MSSSQMLLMGEGAGGVIPAYIEEVFSTYLYAGNESTQTITNGIDLAGKGGLVWLKNRTGSGGNNSNFVFDTARGVNLRLATNLTNAQATGAPLSTTGLTSFNADGFTLGDGYGMNRAGANQVSWTFRNQPKFFQCLTYTGDGTTRTVSHNLGSVPGCIMVKRTDTAGAWQVYHRSLNFSGGTAEQSRIVLNTTAAQAEATFGYWDRTAPTSTLFYLGGDNDVNASGGTYVAYLFAHNAGGFGLTGTDNVISCGSFVPNGSGGVTVDLGYEPQWVLTRAATVADNWLMVDNMRGFNVNSTDSINRLYASLSDAETVNNNISLTSTGFTSFNRLSGGSTYIYIAIRRGPMKVPTSGTSVFAPTIGANLGAGGGLIANAGFPSDLHLEAWKNTTGKYWFDRLRGANQYIQSTSTSAEASDTGRSLANMLGMVYSTTNNFSNAVVYDFRRAPSFFDEVCYTGGITSNPSHNLGVTPEMYIVKCRSSGTSDRGWYVYHSGYDTANNYILMNSASGLASLAGVWSSGPTATTFGVANGYAVNDSGQTYVTYLFATCAGVSKVGSYTGTAALQTVNCGFTSGARFVLIKRTDSTGDWWTYDSTRGITSGNDPYLYLNTTAAEVTNTNYVDTTAVGFQVTAAAPAGLNASGGSYIFLAIA